MESTTLDFHTFKLQVMKLTGLERDALHIYVGIGVFLLTLLMSRVIIKRHISRLNMALLLAILFALLGEYLDLRANYPNITGDNLRDSIHDIINTSFWPVVLYIVVRWTELFRR